VTDAASAEQYIGRRAVDPHGSKIGFVGQVYLDDATGQPDWITVNTGLFATQENFVPLQGTLIDGDDIVLPFDKDVVKDSPHIADSSHLDTAEEQSLYAYYEPYLKVGPASNTRNDATSTAGSDAALRTAKQGDGRNAASPNTETKR